jgi:dTDP-glucose 4,6-dehydratase
VKLLVCGGAGFIGSNFVRIRVRDHGDDVVVLDKLTYAGRRENLADVEHRFVHGAIEDPAAAADAMEGADAVVNFAAETHVDRRSPSPTRSSGRTRPGHGPARAGPQQGVRYLQVSTDEVYGSIEEGSFTRARRSRRRRPTARRRPAPTCSSARTSTRTASRR